jgi:hypothetical protein
MPQMTRVVGLQAVAGTALPIGRRVAALSTPTAAGLAAAAGQGAYPRTSSHLDLASSHPPCHWCCSPCTPHARVPESSMRRLPAGAPHHRD